MRASLALVAQLDAASDELLVHVRQPPAISSPSLARAKGISGDVGERGGRWSTVDDACTSASIDLVQRVRRAQQPHHDLQASCPRVRRDDHAANAVRARVPSTDTPAWC